jgi:hypothetical protein
MGGHLRTATASGQERPYHLAVDIGKPELSPLEPIGQPRVVQSEQVQNCRMQVMHVRRVFRREKAE